MISASVKMVSKSWKKCKKSTENKLPMCDCIITTNAKINVFKQSTVSLRKKCSKKKPVLILQILDHYVAYTHILLHTKSLEIINTLLRQLLKRFVVFILTGSFFTCLIFDGYFFKWNIKDMGFLFNNFIKHKPLIFDEWSF